MFNFGGQQLKCKSRAKRSKDLGSILFWDRRGCLCAYGYGKSIIFHLFPALLFGIIFAFLASSGKTNSRLGCPSLNLLLLLLFWHLPLFGVLSYLLERSSGLTKRTMGRTKITMDLAKKTIEEVRPYRPPSDQPELGSIFPRSLWQIESERLPTAQWTTKARTYNHGQIHWDSTAFYLSNHFLSHILGSFGPPTPPFNVAWGK